MLVVQKVLNSSVVLVKDEQQQEYILLAKGIGYGIRPGTSLDEKQDGRIFMPCDDHTKRRFLELVNEVSSEYFDIAHDIVCYAENLLETKLQQSVCMALADHIHFAVIRMKSGILLTNRLYWEIKSFYKKEFAVGMYALQQVQRMFGVDFPEEEVANIAFHIINAEKADQTGNYDAMRAAKLIGSIMSIVTYSLHVKLDKESLSYARFITHLQFFVERFFTNRMLNDSKHFLFQFTRNSYPTSVACAEKIRTLIRKEYEVMIPDEEVAYMAVYLERLVQDVRQKDGEGGLNTK